MPQQYFVLHWENRFLVDRTEKIRVLVPEIPQTQKQGILVIDMSGCGCGCNTSEGGPFSKGKALVEFVFHAHGGAVRDQKIMQGPLQTVCQGCNAPFLLETYLGLCPECGGVHAVAPMGPTTENIQYAGKDYRLPL